MDVYLLLSLGCRYILMSTSAWENHSIRDLVSNAIFMRPASSYPILDLPVHLIVPNVISFHCRTEPVMCSSFLSA